MYYAIIIVAVIMFGANFALQDVYQKMRGDSLKVSLQATVIGSFASFIVMLIINKFKFEYTHFTLLIAIIMSLVNIGFTFFSFKALNYINISLYSLFSMLGGMLLPFLQGVFFYDEEFTVAKAGCVLFIVIALILTINRDGNNKGNPIYYIGVFILNGLSGVINKIFISSPLEKTSSAGLNMWIAITSIVIALLLLMFFLKIKTEKPITLLNSGVIAASGTVSRIANFLLVIALMHLDASVQYPMVTGGVMIVSTIICFFGKKKPSVKEMLSVAFAFLGMLMLIVIPI